MENTVWIFAGVIAVVIILTSIPVVMKSMKLMKDSVNTLKQDGDIVAIGTQAEAVVHSITQTNTTYNNNPQVILEMTVTKEDGETFTARVKTVIPVVNIPQYQPGSTITVKYVEENGERRVAVLGAYRLN